MSKFFYRGTPDIMGKYGKSGYSPQPNVKPGSAAQPLSLSVRSTERQAEIAAILEQHQLVANLDVNAEDEENIAELETVLNKPQTQRFEKTPQRNDPCSCGSGKKYKKCCG